MKLKKFAPKKNAAQAIVEFAIVLPILLLLLYGLLEAGRLLFMYSSVVTASRQAARYGSATGQGGNWTTEGGPNNSGVARYQDCYGIRRAAQRADYLNAFGNNDVVITYDGGNGVAPPFTDSICTGNTDTTIVPANNNTTRINVQVTGHFSSIVPKIVPFIGRNVTTTSARTILMAISIEVASSGGGAATTGVTVTTNPNPSEPGQPVTVSVQVNNLSGSATPTGTVVISADGSNCTVTLSGGMGTCSNAYLFYSNTTVSAAYTSDDTTKFTDSSGSVLHQVGPATTITTVSDTADPSLRGLSVTIFITVANQFPGGAIPTGTVTVSTAAGGCNITLSGGQGNCSVTFNALGVSNITASYVPADTTKHKPSTGSSPHEVVTVIPNTPIPPTAIPPTTVPPTVAPVTGCDYIRNNAGAISFSGKTMTLTLKNTVNNYPVTIGSIFVAWNYSAGHIGGDESLWLLNADLNGTVFWSSSVPAGINQPSALLPLSTTVTIPANGTATIKFTFDKIYNRLSNTEQVQIQFSTFGCEAYPVIRPAGMPTITPVPSGGLKLQLISGGTDTNQQTQFRYQLQNTGASAVSNISVRIYFTIDSPNKETDYVLEKYWDESGVATISGPTQVTNKIFYFTVSYGAASLGPGGIWQFQTSLHLSSWGSNYDATNDWWHNTGALPGAWTDWVSIPAYANGSRVWGNEP